MAGKHEGSKNPSSKPNDNTKDGQHQKPQGGKHESKGGGKK